MGKKPKKQWYSAKEAASIIMQMFLIMIGKILSHVIMIVKVKCR